MPTHTTNSPDHPVETLASERGALVAMLMLVVLGVVGIFIVS